MEVRTIFRRNKLTCAILALLTALLLTGCQKTELPDSIDKEAMLDAGAEIVALLADEDYQAVADAFRSDVREEYSIDADAVKAVMDQVSGAGAYVKTSQTSATGGKNDSFDEPYGVALLYCEHEEADIIYELSFDTNLNLIGMQVKQK